MANNRASTWGIARINTVEVDHAFGVSSRESRIPAKSFKVFRKFPTRDAARTYRKALRNPAGYKVIDMFRYEVVR